MAQRPEITPEFIFKSCGKNKQILATTYGGAVETPLDKFYPWLNEEEMIAFFGGSWSIRRKQKNVFFGLDHASDIYQIFKEAFDVGFQRLRYYGKPWSNLSMPLPTIQREIQEELNPFKFRGDDFRARLAMVEESDVEELIERLHLPRNIYISAGRRDFYNGTESLHSRHFVMEFQPYSFVGITTEQICFNYANEIARLLHGYPRDYEWPLEQKELTFK